jgi:DNA-directed RNA polymerase specialized sigma subunit
LRTSHDLKQSEIASQLGRSQMHVSRLLKRAATKLTAPA